MKIFRKISRLPLRQWVKLEDFRRRIEKHAENGEWQRVPQIIFDSIELCGGRNKKEPWDITAKKYIECLGLNQPRVKFPILTSKEKAKKMPWEYDGRTWYFWINLFAGSYGWKEEEVGRLDIDEAIGLYQEILVNEQLDQEFWWGLSETSWEYMKSTGKSKLRQLPRPDWMNMYSPEDKKKAVPKIKILASSMPTGNVIFLDET